MFSALLCYTHDSHHPVPLEYRAVEPRQQLQRRLYLAPGTGAPSSACTYNTLHPHTSDRHSEPRGQDREAANKVSVR